MRKFIGSRNHRSEKADLRLNAGWMNKGDNMKVKWIGKTDLLSLVHNKVYDVLSVEKGWYRIKDETDEDYLYPPDEFEIVE